MKITKFVHSCLLVETPDRVALFDPGSMSTPHINLENITKLDDVFVTHQHGDHIDHDFIKQLVAKFPQVRITTTPEVVQELKAEGVTASNTPPEGVTFFDSPHEKIKPYFPVDPPQEIGVHYLDVLSHPGDSHSFKETKAILALPVSAPWGSLVDAAELGLELKPKYILPIHDWHWSDEARDDTYDKLEKLYQQNGITFYKLQTGVPVEIPV